VFSGLKKTQKFVVLSQCIETVSSSTLLGSIFANFSGLYITSVDSGVVKPGNYHPTLVIDIYFSFFSYIQNYKYSYRKFASGDYTLLYNIS
jgi:hypothetical protein